MSSTATLSLEDQLNVKQDVRLPETPSGQIMAGKGFQEAALRFERCREVVPRKCEHGHIDRRILLTCGYRFMCFNCAEQWAKERHASQADVIERLVLMTTEKQFTFVKLETHLPPDPMDLPDVGETLVRDLPPGSMTPPFSSRVFGFRGGKFTWGIIVLGNKPIEYWKNLWPDSEIIQINIVPMYRLAYFHAKVLLAPFIPADPREAVENQLWFKGVHLVDKFEDTKKQGDSTGTEEEKFVQGDSPTEMSNSNTSNEFHICQVCKCRLTKIATTSHPPYFNPLQVEWRDIPPPESP